MTSVLTVPGLTEIPLAAVTPDISWEVGQAVTGGPRSHSLHTPTLGIPVQELGERHRLEQL